MTILLAVDTSTSVNTVAVCRGARRSDATHEVHLLAETAVECRRLHSERLLATVDWVLEEAGIAFSDVDALAVSIGPGSFTGLRIGAATWKGLAFGRGLPLAAVPTLDAMARLLPLRDAVVCPLLDARMKEVFGAVYRYQGGTREKLTPDRACPVEDLLQDLPAQPQEAPVYFLGDGAQLYRERIEKHLPNALFLDGYWNIPRASAVAAEGYYLLQSGAVCAAALAAPIYLRQSQAELNRAARDAVAGRT